MTIPPKSRSPLRSNRKPRRVRGEQSSKVGRVRPKSTKTSRTIVPPPQSARIVQKFITGRSIRQIAREEGRDRATITKIVRSSEVQNYVEKIREQYFGLGELALSAVRKAIQEEKDGRLAYQLLKDIGVVPSSAERNLSNIQAQQQAEEDSEEARVQTWMGRLIRVVFEKSRVYGTPIGDPLEDALGQIGVRFDPKTGKFTEIENESDE
jgi:hypothetical protein